LPWAIAATALGVVLHQYPPRRIAAEIVHGEIFAMTPFAAALIGIGIFIVSGSDLAVFSGVTEATALRAPGYLAVVRARAVLSLFDLVGYAAAIGGTGVWFARVTGCGAGLASGVVLYVVSTDLVAVSLAASLAVWLGQVPVSDALRFGGPALCVALGALQLGVLARLTSRIDPRAALAPWARISRRGALVAIVLRTTNIYWLTLCSWGAARAFGMTVPLWAFAAIFPIVLVVGSSPVNVAGFGAVQGAWLLLVPWAKSGEQVLAFSFCWHLVLVVAVVLRGLPFLRSVVGEIAGAPALLDDATGSRATRG
jgi:hypothetical protein